MQHNTIRQLCLFTLLTLTACDGNTSSTSTQNPPIDACPNYDGIQNPTELTTTGFVINHQGHCQLKHNHDALAFMGIDTVRLAGWTGANIPVALIDSGFRPSHQTIKQHIHNIATYHDQNANYSLDNGEKSTNEPSNIIAAHGTAIAALLTTTAPNTQLWLKATGDENPFTRDLTIATLDALQNDHLKIINHANNLLSDGLIYRSAHDDETGILPALIATPTIIIAAAGNQGHDLSARLDTAQAQVPTLTTFLDVPSEAQHILLIGVYDPINQQRAAFSNRPGHRTNVQARFLAIAGVHLTTASSGNDTAYRNVSGTSFAVPVVSGALAILLETNPTLTPIAAANMLLQTASQPSELGYGTPCTVNTAQGNLSTDCGAMQLGRGIMNLAAAVALAAKYEP